MPPKPALSLWNVRPRVRSTWRCCKCWQYSYATTTSGETLSVPPLLSKLRAHMKEALKTKDKVRLNVLRSILTETTALEKRSRPVTTDKQVYNVIEKQIKASTKAAEEFALASRSDLQDKENAQIQIMEEFRDEVETVSQEEAVDAVKSAIEKLQVDGITPKRERVRRLLFGPGGTFEDKVVNDRHGEMAKTINSLVHKVAPSKPDNPRKTVSEGQSE